MDFNSLPNDMVYEIFSRMEPTELLATENVSKEWQQMVRETLKRIQTVVMKKHEEMYFDSCRHLTDDCRVMSLINLFNYIKEEKEARVEEIAGKRLSGIEWSEGLLMPRGMQIFSNSLNKLTGLRSIDFGFQKITVQNIVQAFELCPLLECVIIGTDELDFFNLIILDENDWTDFVNRFGSRLKHVAMIYIDNSEPLFMSLAESLSSINHHLEMISFVFFEITEDVFTLLSQIQTANAFIQIRFRNVLMNFINPIDDIINKLRAYRLPWNMLPNECQRLSCLDIYSLDSESISSNHFKTVSFSGLKKLDVANFNELTLRVFSGCRFPLLKQLFLYVSFDPPVADVNQLFDQLFEKMPLLATVEIKDYSLSQHQLPGPAILRLDRLTDLSLFVNLHPDWNLQIVIATLDVIKQLASLKTLSFDYHFEINVDEDDDDDEDEDDWPEEQKNQWREAIQQRLVAMKQERPELVVNDDYVFEDD